MIDKLRDKVRKLAQWQRYIVTKQVVGNDEIPHPAAAPISTDQEAGGSSSTPDGEIINNHRSNDNSLKNNINEQNKPALRGSINDK